MPTTRSKPATRRSAPGSVPTVKTKLIEAEPDETTEPGRLGYERGYGETFPGGWMTVQLATLVSPPSCSICLQPCQSTRRIGALKIPITVCPSCKSRSIWRGLLTGVAVLTVYIFAAMGVTYPMSPRELEDKGPLIYVLAVVCAVASLVVINRLWQPMRSRRRSVERNTVALRFSRRPFAEEFFALNRQRARLLLDQQSISLSTPASDGQYPHQV